MPAPKFIHYRYNKQTKNLISSIKKIKNISLKCSCRYGLRLLYFLPLNCNIHPVYQGVIPNAYTTTNHTRSFLLYILMRPHSISYTRNVFMHWSAVHKHIYIYVWLRELPSCNQTFNTWPFLPKINWSKMHILRACILQQQQQQPTPYKNNNSSG